MKKQVVIVHGGATFDAYTDYIKDLKKTKVDIHSFKSKTRTGWKGDLEKKLGRSFEMLLPRMPSAGNARYKEWKIWFERMLPFLKKDAILVGHSLGGIFLAKYLSQNILKKKARALVLIAAPFDDAENESLGDFVLPSSLRRIEAQVDVIFLFQSKDDPVVPFKEVGKYKKALPTAQVRLFARKGHFNQESFPELVRVLKKI